MAAPVSPAFLLCHVPSLEATPTPVTAGPASEWHHVVGVHRAPWSVQHKESRVPLTRCLGDEASWFCCVSGERLSRCDNTSLLPRCLPTAGQLGVVSSFTWQFLCPVDPKCAGEDLAGGPPTPPRQAAGGACVLMQGSCYFPAGTWDALRGPLGSSQRALWGHRGPSDCLQDWGWVGCRTC